MGKKYFGFGNSNFAASYDVAVEGPFDTRAIVQNKSDLTLTNTWKSYKADGVTSNGDQVYVYDGMLVVVASDSTVYTLTSKDHYTSIVGENGATQGWKQIDAGAAIDNLKSITTSSTTDPQIILNVKALGASGTGISSNASLFNNGNVIDSKYLPSYIDDIIEVYVKNDDDLEEGTLVFTSDSAGTNTITPETGKLYIVARTEGQIKNGYIYRYAGNETGYVLVNSGDTDTRVTQLESLLTWKTLSTQGEVEEEPNGGEPEEETEEEN